MLKIQFEGFIDLSRNLRPNYPASLGEADDNWINHLNMKSKVPKLYTVIYSCVKGTPRSISDQRLMDFIPGYRLIHVEEVTKEKLNLDNIIMNHYSQYRVIPLLANYSSDFICFVEDEKGNACICEILHDEGELTLMHRTPEDFLKTITEFYKRNVYFLDEDGYLDLDWDKESLVGAQLNPGVNFWE